MEFTDTKIEILVMGLADNVSLASVAQVHAITGGAESPRQVKTQALADLGHLLQAGLIVIGPEDSLRAVVEPHPGSPEEVMQKLSDEWGEQHHFELKPYGGSKVSLTPVGVEEAQGFVRTKG